MLVSSPRSSPSAPLFPQLSQAFSIVLLEPTAVLLSLLVAVSTLPIVRQLFNGD